MKKKRKFDDDMPIGPLRRVADFLPPPHKLVFSGKPMAKITILLDLETVYFFRDSAKRNNTKYQKMIREVLRHYARMHGPNKAA